ncbi:MAG TPA: aminotransferase class I/II-fold pyridoxal phosphate-dependent enzyme [Candidatus Saccharicenans sp.]|nr:aminotransferase class I/II-fold pyridoxal phosphate-dependent enzyme [Candidatus Saccharicenans sp.]HQO75561.1 aminotransferase class I/II-fold pyridoxal phosphate-dependent enzyme [Candidatus Saccharicenans sp.]HUM79190.1 aminotransferase class I/II-fold pyridoxal phosphate-dependent enzyme [Candidatus Saccharicenans sp.]
MKIEVFKMERMQSLWENLVDYNLSESGVHPLTLKELLSAEEIQDLTEVELGYTQTNGTPPLRQQIARLYPGLDPEDIMVTAGSSEANFLLMWSLIEPGDKVVFELPNYLQMWGLTRAFGARVEPLWLKEELGWQPDPAEIDRVITPGTKLVILTNPNNPTGSILKPGIRQQIIERVKEVGAWLIADEVYRGAERNGEETPSFYGQIEKVAVVGGLSKAYGLPGLRLGWLAGPAELVQKVWTYHDYTTISVSALTDHLATRALEPTRRLQLLNRTRNIIKTNLPILEKWLQSFDGLFNYQPPQAGAILFTAYKSKINSTQLVEKLLKEKNVLLVPGDHFELDHHLRLGYGSPPDYLQTALDRITEFLKESIKDLK